MRRVYLIGIRSDNADRPPFCLSIIGYESNNPINTAMLLGACVVCFASAGIWNSEFDYAADNVFLVCLKINKYKWLADTRVVLNYPWLPRPSSLKYILQAHSKAQLCMYRAGPVTTVMTLSLLHRTT